MTAAGESILSRVIPEGVDVRPVEPHIFSVIRECGVDAPYDAGFGYIYDRVACNRLYNFLIWGYSVNRFASIVHTALTSSGEGCVLDLGCGSLAFTAKIYCRYPGRPVILVDQSLRMLRIAKSRLIRLNGTIPDNMVFLHADALRLPFRRQSFNTIVSLNLLHCLEDTRTLLTGLRNFLFEETPMYFTTLVQANRLADRYLHALALKGKLVVRTMEQHRDLFQQSGMAITYEIEGNMAFISVA